MYNTCNDCSYVASAVVCLLSHQGLRDSWVVSTRVDMYYHEFRIGMESRSSASFLPIGRPWARLCRCCLQDAAVTNKTFLVMFVLDQVDRSRPQRQVSMSGALWQHHTGIHACFCDACPGVHEGLAPGRKGSAGSKVIRIVLYLAAIAGERRSGSVSACFATRDTASAC
jgi:hypothetical protein